MFPRKALSTRVKKLQAPNAQLRLQYRKQTEQHRTGSLRLSFCGLRSPSSLELRRQICLGGPRPSKRSSEFSPTPPILLPLFLILLERDSGLMRFSRIHSAAMPIARRRLTLFKPLLCSHSSKCRGFRPRHRKCQPRKSVLKKDKSVESTPTKLTWKDVPVPRGSTHAGPPEHLKSPTRMGHPRSRGPAGPPQPSPAPCKSS